MAKRRGNPSWGKPEPFLPTTPSTFESLVKVLKLTPDQYKDSAALKDWVRQNRTQKYVPQELLRAWGFTVESEV